MLRIKNRHTSLTRAQLHDGTVVEANSTGTLRRAVVRRLQEIGYVTGNLDAYFADAACKMLPPGMCVQTDDAPPRKLSLPDVVTFLQTMGKWIGQGGRFVDDDLVRKRADVCASCPRNKELPGCKSCSGVASMISGFIGGREVHAIQRLNGCEVCGCSLSAKVLIPASAIPKGDYPEWCWVTTEKKAPSSPTTA